MNSRISHCRVVTARWLASVSTVVLLYLSCPIAGYATLITIEPDDYAEGSDLSFVSSYVRLRALSGDSGTESGPVYAVRSTGLPGAPTGALGFGKHPGGLGLCSTPARLECHMGLGFTFSQPIDWISLLAVNTDYSPGLQAAWFAFDVDDELIDSGFSLGSGALGEVFSIDLAVPGAATYVFGGADSIAAMEFDRLSFQVKTAVGVSAPDAMALSILGFAFCLMRIAGGPIRRVAYSMLRHASWR